MRALIERMAKALVDNPEEVQVTESETDGALLVELRVAKADLGMVIGKKGRTARALRDILAAASGKMKKHASLEIIDG